MSKATYLAFISMAVFLVLFTGTVGKPGLPPTLKADEPAYLAMAMSLVEDGDLESNPEDYPRLLASYPYLPTENLIIMSDDGWKTVYFGKPFIYSLMAAPLVAVFGANGMVVFNALLFVLMIWCGAWYLRRWNSEPIALLYSVLFFALSPAWPYVFWLQPEIFNMASVAMAFFLVFQKFGGHRWSRGALPASGVALALGVYNKPVLLAFAVPLAYAIWRRHGIEKAGVWIGALAIGLLALAGSSMALTGHPTSYLGVARGGVKVEDPQSVQDVIESLPDELAKASKYANSWSWVFRKPPTSVPEVRQSLGYFLWGRHTGVLLYLPFSVVSLLLFLIHSRHRPEGWLSLAAMAVITLFFICVIPLNWHGGGGFIGNRYFMMCYPAFLFLVTSVRPAWLMLPGAAAGGLFLGSILFTPFGAAVPLPTLQAHARSPQFDAFPFELSLRKTIPGYSSFSYSHLVLMGRKDLLMPHRKQRGVPWVQARVPVDVMVLTDRRIKGLFFQITTFAPDNEVTIDLAGDRAIATFEKAHRKAARSKVVEVRPVDAPRLHHDQDGALFYVYDMRIRTTAGKRIYEAGMPTSVFVAGAQLDFLGRRDQITRPEHYRVDWLEALAPEEVEARETFEIPVRLRNTSQSNFTSGGLLPVNIAYRWFGPDGNRLRHAGKRTHFAGPVEPGAELETTVEVRAPNTTGDLKLELDLVRENIAWFSDIASQAKTLAIRVVEPESID